MAAEPATAPPPARAAPVAAPTEQQPAAPGAGAPKKAGKKDAKGGKAAKKGKKGKAPAPEAGESGGPSVAAHPRAARGVARAKSWGGLIGFVLGGYLSLPTNTLAAAGLRALAAGVVGYVAVWAGAVFVWRRLVVLELKGREQQLLAASLPDQPAAVERADARQGA